LKNIEEAILGVPNERDADGTLIIRGFVADMGRLPRVVIDSTTHQATLEELWLNPGNHRFTQQPAPQDPSIIIGAGWRGGYLANIDAQIGLQDGWGRAFDLLQGDGITLADQGGQDIRVLRSRGADGLVNDPTQTVNAFDKDQERRIDSIDGTVSTSRFTADINGTISAVDSTGNATAFLPGEGKIYICLYEPDGDTGGVKVVFPSQAEVTFPDSADPSFTLGTVDPDGGIILSATETVNRIVYHFANVPIGPRVICIYQDKLITPSTALSSPIADKMNKSKHVSGPARFMVLPGGVIKDFTFANYQITP